MEIVICGAGKVGEVLCCDLSLEHHKVVVIEANEKRLDEMICLADVTGVHGNGALSDVQIEAGVKTCDMFIAVTPNDETNIIAAITAKKLGARHVIARVRNPEYSQQMDFLRESLGITLMINPDLEAALEIKLMLAFPSALSVESFGGGRFLIVEVKLPDNSIYAGRSLRDIGRQRGQVLVAVVERRGEITIPDGDFVLKSGDHLYLTGSPEDIVRFRSADHVKKRRPQSVLIVGGGRITRYLLPRLAPMMSRVKVIENGGKEATSLASDFPDIEVICADGTDQRILCQERMHNYDAVISLTGVDEENLLISIYAAHEGVPITITKVNRTHLLTVLDTLGLQAIVTPKRLIADKIIRFIRSTENSEGSKIEAFYRISNGQAEALQFQVTENSPVCGILLQDLKTKPGLLILCILRGGRIIFPGGSDALLSGDQVVIVTTEREFRDVSDMLEKDFQRSPARAIKDSSAAARLSAEAGLDVEEAGR